MRVIELLNKIANGEEVPKAIMYDGDIWKYDELSNDYEMFDESGDLYLFQEELNITRALNDEVEIIEEDKKIEKLDRDNFTGVSNLEVSGQSATQFDYVIEQEIEDIVDKINEIIDYLEENKKC